MSEKSRLVCALLCWIVGCFGAHRFYTRKIGTGILWIFTFGWLGFGVLIDLIVILCGNFKDKDGNKVVKWMDN